MNTPFIIGITGGSGSGKTSFIRAITQRFSQDQLCVISQDEYYLPRHLQNKDHLGVQNFDLPFSLDRELFKQDLIKLKRGETVHKTEYTFNNPDKEPGIVIYRPAPVLIVEGLFVLYDEFTREMMDLKVFIHAKENLKVIRRIKRDQIERNYPLQDVLYRYEYHVLPSYEQYIKPFMEECDIIINNNNSFKGGLEVISGFIESYISKHKQSQISQ